MGRDWMQIGRRPSGICGACLLLAARMNNFRRSIEEVVQVVKIADVTLRKRLAEFKETASGSLTVNDFRSIWLEETHDPPAYLQGIQREDKQRTERERKLRAESASSEMTEGEGNAFRELADRETTQEAEGAEEGASSPAAKSTVAGKEKDGQEDVVAPSEAGEEVEGEMAPPPKPSKKALGKRKRANQDNAPPSSDAAAGDAADEYLEGRDEIDELMSGELRSVLDSTEGAAVRGQLDERDEEEKKKRFKLSQTPSGGNFDQSDRLDDLDEDELDAFILTPEEVEMKSRLWMANNKDYLKELAGASFSSLSLFLFPPMGADASFLPLCREANRSRRRAQARFETSCSSLPRPPSFPF